MMTMTRADAQKLLRAYTRKFHPDINPSGAGQMKAATEAWSRAYKAQGWAK
jgi:hypothetical protein